MDITIYPKKLKGKINAIPSKSQAHRQLICAAFADDVTELICPATNQDIEATANCLRALGAEIYRTERGYTVSPICSIPANPVLDCGESGSTLRFLLPVVGALGINALFKLGGRLPHRPLSPLWDELERHGCKLTRPTETTISIAGGLTAGHYQIDGGVSSQYITGLLFAMALMEGESRLCITGKTESAPYIEMTLCTLREFGVNVQDFQITGSRPFRSPGKVVVEGDWSNAAFFLAANTLGCQVEVAGLSQNSPQGDRACAEILKQMTGPVTVDAVDIPDLVPILAVTAGALHGGVFKNISRLRLKESDRVATVAAMITALGGHAAATETELTVLPGKYAGCTIDAAGDHRIAMAAAIAATVTNGPITISGAQCVEKSYPSFWEEYKHLGGSYEQHIR